jgi:hypothetical protein
MSNSVLSRVSAWLIPATLLLIISISNEAFLFQSHKNDPNNFFFVLVMEYIIWLALLYIFLIPMFFCYWRKQLSVKMTLINCVIAILSYVLVVFYPDYKFDELSFNLQFDHVIKMCSLALICYLLKYKQNNVGWDAQKAARPIFRR